MSPRSDQSISIVPSAARNSAGLAWQTTQLANDPIDNMNLAVYKRLLVQDVVLEDRLKSFIFTSLITVL
jgi:hypothetical protein